MEEQWAAPSWVSVVAALLGFSRPETPRKVLVPRRQGLGWEGRSRGWALGSPPALCPDPVLGSRRGNQNPEGNRAGFHFLGL